MKAYPHVEAAERYAAGVVDGEIPNCKWVHLACKRYFDDLERIGDPTFPYTYDIPRAERYCRFIEKFPHSKGKWAAEKDNLFRLEPWQSFILCQVFGWVHPESGIRRYHRSFLLVPRKNGKSELTAGVGLIGCSIDGEYGAEVLCGARKLDQAQKVFRPAWTKVNRSPDFRDEYGAELGGTHKNPRAIHFARDMSVFRPVVGNPGDGDSPHFAIIDEYHEHGSADLLETFETGMGARENGLLWVISTAGADTSGPCYQLQLRAQHMLEGALPDDHLFAMIYGLDEEDDWTDPAMMEKANPNLDVSVFSFFVRQQVKEALADPQKEAAVKTKHFNLWVGARQPWMLMESWKAAGDPKLDPADLVDCPRFVGVDLSSKKDLSCRCDLYLRVEDDGHQHIYAFWETYVPRERLDEKEGKRYRGWVTEGYITATPGAIMDHRLIEQRIIDSHAGHAIVEAGVDPWNSTQLAVGLMESGIAVVQVDQTTRQLSEPMKWIEALVRAGRFHHRGNPAVQWMIGNVVAREDANENLFPRKEKAELKIDAATALLNAMNRALPYRGESGQSVYETRGPLVFG